MIETNAFKRGVCLVFRDQPMMIVDVNFSTPTARGSNTIAKSCSEPQGRSLEIGAIYISSSKR